MAQTPRGPQTRASQEPPALATQQAPDRPSPLVAETARLQMDHAYLAGSQIRDATLGPMPKESASGKYEYLTDDNGVLWYAPMGKQNTLAIPRTLIPGVLSLVHSNFGHPGVPRTAIPWVRDKYTW